MEHQALRTQAVVAVVVDQTQLKTPEVVLVEGVVLLSSTIKSVQLLLQKDKDLLLTITTKRILGIAVTLT